MTLTNNTKGVLLALFCTAIVSVAQISLKKGSAVFSLAPDQIINQLTNFPLLLGGALYVIGAFFFIHAFRRGELSVIYPVMASGYVVVTLLSVFFLDEIVTLQKGGGMLLIMSGVILIGRQGQRHFPTAPAVEQKSTEIKRGDHQQ